ncbi:complement resistance protein TraT [Desulfovibrio legallii]|uniref:TraT complement resistance protein n=1 Tax=Desulfovibrio legallii TaxID=571438 RepID=A0A1G7ISY2_9BACT|nr:complement resistance protein TraT [Desulfovibrio legallii]SDF15664.1 TraT complement resistance protein [Desulfovibrio legallii]
MAFPRSALLALFCCLLPLCACVRQQGDPARLEVLRAGALEDAANDAEIPRLVYLGLRDNSGHAPGLRPLAEARLRQAGYELVPNPSQAGYILQMNVLAAGPTDPATARAVVAAGYDAPSRLAGQGGTALVADVLLVLRRVPSAAKPGRARLKNISSRNAISDSQMRLGLLLSQRIRQEKSLPPYFMETLAKELAQALHAATDGAPDPADAAAFPAGPEDSPPSP